MKARLTVVLPTREYVGVRTMLSCFHIDTWPRSERDGDPGASCIM